MSQTVIVLRDASVLAVSGQEGKSPRLQTVVRVPVPGFGEPYERWKNALAALKKEIAPGPVRVVLPESLCSARILQLPYIKGKKLDEMVKRELGEAGKSEIQDYIVLTEHKKEGMTVCCGEVEKPVVDRLSEIFRQAGYEITGMTVSRECYMKLLLPYRSRLREQTAVILFFDEDGVNRFLIEKGHYRFSGKSRIFSEPGTTDFGTEIVRNISGMMQFQAANKDVSPITDVYYVGCEEQDFEAASPRIRDMGLKIHALDVGGLAGMPEGESAGDWMMEIGAMMCAVRGKQDLNLVQRTQTKERNAMAVTILKIALFPAIALSLSLIATGVISSLTWVSESHTEDLLDWMSLKVTREQHQRALDLEKENNSLRHAIASMTQTQDHLDTYPEITVSLWDTIQKAGKSNITAELTGYDSHTGEISFVAKSPEVIDIPAYVSRLEKTGVFFSVSYTGYLYDYDADIYRLTLSCILTEKEGGGDGQ